MIKSFILSLLLSLSSICLGNTMETFDSKRSTIKIHGTSSLHDWTMEAREFSVALTESAAGMIKIDVQVPVSKILSDSNTMDNKAHEALKGKEHPVIRFTSADVKLPTGIIEIPGQLSMAGASKTISVKNVSHVLDEGRRMISGEAEIDMTEFHIKPPSVLFITVGKTVKVNFHIQLITSAK